MLPEDLVILFIKLRTNHFSTWTIIILQTIISFWWYTSRYLSSLIILGLPLLSDGIIPIDFPKMWSLLFQAWTACSSGCTCEQTQNGNVESSSWTTSSEKQKCMTCFQDMIHMNMMFVLCFESLIGWLRWKGWQWALSRSGIELSGHDALCCVLILIDIIIYPRTLKSENLTMIFAIFPCCMLFHNKLAVCSYARHVVLYIWRMVDIHFKI